jgi:NADPH-dependent 2,4-dienoyl-CoA reductase/sulfur reductase-like enzyme
MMRSTKHLLIGGGLACSQAAKILRMKDPDGSIMLVGKERHLPYDRPPLSKGLLRGEKSAEQIFYDPQSFFDEKNIDVVLGNPAVALSPDDKTAELDTGTKVTFQKALIATGGKPITLDAPGSELGGVLYLRTVDDALRISAEGTSGKRAVIVGAGFIGMEVAASLTQRGVAVTVIEMLPRVWPRFVDESFAKHIQEYCTARGIQFRTGEKVTELHGPDRVESVVTASGDEISCDMVCVGIGIVPETIVAQQAGLEVDDGIVVNERLQTSHPDIYAGGDVANYPDPVFNKRRRVEHWGHAEYCGQVAALNMVGAGQKYDLLSYVWSDLFDLHIEFAGDESEYDRVLTRGGFGDPSFTMLYLKDSTLRAYLAVNTSSREFPKMQRLIRRAVDLNGKEAELCDPTFELKSLL